jgi:Sulfotransferase family
MKGPNGTTAPNSATGSNGQPAVQGLVTPRGNGHDPSADPVFVVCAGRSGSTLLRFLLDAHPDLACPPETRLPAMCTQIAAVWQQLASQPPSNAAAPGESGGPPPVPEPAIAGIRQTMNLETRPPAETRLPEPRAPRPACG